MLLLLTFIQHIANASAPPTGYKYFDVLELSLQAKSKDVAKAYREMSKRYHPDRNKSPDAHEKFAEVAAAYEVLNDEKQRSEYIRLGHDDYVASKKHGGGGGHDEPFWGEFPFFFGGGRRRGMEKAPSLNLHLHVTLEQLYFGDFLHVSYRRPALCVHAESCATARHDCADAGVRIVQQHVAPGFSVQNEIQDDSCITYRKGWKKNCPKCPNGPTEMENTFLSVYVEPGMTNGQSINFPKRGEQTLGHESGDFKVEINTQQHSMFTRNGNNLHMELRLTLLEALTGFSKQIQHISRQPVLVERTEIVAERETMTLSGKGMPILGQDGSFGDLIIQFQVQYPVELDERQRSSIQEALNTTTKWKYAVLA